MRAALLLFVCAWIFAPMQAAEDAYAAWQAGRPTESLPALQAQAETSDAWQDWFDAGLCAAAAEQRGLAVAAFLRAHDRAPWRDEPVRALSTIGSPLPPTWRAWLGPLAWPGSGWCGAVLAVIAGVSFAAATFHARRRGRWLALGCPAVLALLPGVIATWHDQALPLAAVVVDSRLLDATGKPVRALPAGTLVTLGDQDVWQGRHLVILSDGNRGYVPQGDLAR
jgi:hypothetical protein